MFTKITNPHDNPLAPREGRIALCNRIGSCRMRRVVKIILSCETFFGETSEGETDAASRSMFLGMIARVASAAELT